MNILAIETGSEFCQVALQIGGRRVFRQIQQRSHSQIILSLIDELLDESAPGLKELDVVAVNHGPGSFTGIRVGVSVAQGLAFSNDLPLIGLSSLEMLAHSALRLHDGELADNVVVFAAIDARMSQIYCAWFKGLRQKEGFKVEPIGDATVISPERLNTIDIPAPNKNLSLYCAGSGLTYIDDFPIAYQQIDTLSLASTQSDERSGEIDLNAMLDLAEYEFERQLTQQQLTHQHGQQQPDSETKNWYIEPVYLRNNVTG